MIKKQLETAENNNRKELDQKIEYNSRSHKDLEMSYRKLDINQKKHKEEYEKEMYVIS